MISVIVVSFNGREIIGECLNSLKNQSIKNIEIIFVDNGSKDFSYEYVKENFPDIDLIKLENNTGFAKANNFAIKKSKYEFIALINNDAVADTYWLEKLHNAIQKDSFLGSCTSKILLYKKNIIDTAGDTLSIFGYGYKRGHGENINKYNNPEEVLSASGCACMYRKKALEKIGLFDEDFFAYYEDVDLSLRLQLNGYKCLYVPEAIVYHKLGSTSKIGSNLFIYLTQRNQEYVLIKNLPFTLLIFIYPLHIIYIIYTIIRFTLNGKFKIAFKAKKDAFSDFSKMLKKRMNIQKNRKISGFKLLNKFLS